MTTRPTPCGFISDGYTLDFEIPERPGESVGIRGKRRPMPNLILTTYLDACRPTTYKPPEPNRLPKGVTAAQWIENQIDAARSAGIAAQIVEWDLADINGNPVPVSADAVSKIYPPRLLANLMDTVCGSYTPDQTQEQAEGGDAADEKN